ncbi:hypothetical protein, conserved [Babesia bigemina]|uniref:Uncharacterized protein n=1 Tax=Babesia bigemina TaxID=5866 RepID=A0A061BL47_BABBI|nr:hypothetical protein, conserved [Babesia bigemina]CDR71605.1 hypothetical protein, conserved [Babesia bigemina]|eukprot:XP_012770552.1 hypothetical protein, conserved [Babesia bigemina]
MGATILSDGVILSVRGSSGLLLKGERLEGDSTLFTFTFLFTTVTLTLTCLLLAFTFDATWRRFAIVRLPAISALPHNWKTFIATVEIFSTFHTTPGTTITYFISSTSITTPSTRITWQVRLPSHLPLPLPSTCRHVNHLSNALTNCNTYHCRSQSPHPANISITQATHSPTATHTTAAPSPLTLQTYQSLKQRTHQLQHVPLPLPVPSTCKLINHSSSTHLLQHVPLPLPVPSTCEHVNHLSSTHQLQHYHCRSHSPQPANYQSPSNALTNYNMTYLTLTPVSPSPGHRHPRCPGYHTSA